MKKKFLSVLFALVLVLSFSLIPAMPVAAQVLPTVTLDVPDNVYRPEPFDVSSTTTNDGIEYTNVRFNITVSGPEAFTGAREDIFTITYVNDGDNEGINETFVLVDGSFVGYWGPAEGFTLPAGYDVTSTFTIQMTDVTTAPVGDYEVTVALVDLTPEPDVTLATATDGFSLWTAPLGTKAYILKESGVPGKGLDKAPGLQKPFNPKSKAGEHAGKKDK